MRLPLALAMSAVLALSACGGGSYEDTDVDQIEKDVRTAMTGLESFRIKGSMVDGEQTIDLDLAMARTGDCEGTMSVKGVGAFELLVTDGTSYFKADEEFWTNQGGPQGSQIAQMVGDKWVSAEGGMEQVSGVCDFEEFVSEFEKDDDEGDLKEVTGTSEIDGEDVVEVSFESEDGNDGTTSIRASDPHYVVRMEVAEEGEMTFSEFDEPVEPEAPASDEVVDLSKLAG